MNRKQALRIVCEHDLLSFAKYIYKENHNRKFVDTDHFRKIAQTLEAVYRGEITRLIINIPPRY